MHGYRKPILWVSDKKNIPPRPDNPDKYPMEDYRHWYDKEYAGWNVVKSDIPSSPADGPGGKRIICLLPGYHPYHEAYKRGMLEAVSAFGINLSFKYSDWDEDEQQYQVKEAIAASPDMIILVPENSVSGSLWYKEINSYGIPVIASNLLPEDEGFKYILTWTGPDDWGQSRALARVFAEKMKYSGGYCIVSHIPGCSAYYARTWGMITELKRIAPEMKLLSMDSTDLDTDKTYSLVKGWLKEFGTELSGIVSADDNLVQLGINRALSESKRDDVVKVANGSTSIGIRMLKEGKLDAITFQSAELDGALPIQVAVDWFNGLEVPPVRNLPVHILTKDNVEEFVFNYNTPGEIDMNLLYRMIVECDSGKVEAFFDSIYGRFSATGVLTVEYFRGFTIELLSNLLNIIKRNELSEKELIGDYETIFKKLFNQKTTEGTLQWLKDVSLRIIEEMKDKTGKPKTLIQQIVEFVDTNYMNPISLKVISGKFNISAAYIGRLFKEETGTGFTKYLNNLRIEQAKILLASTPERANKIALEVGYSDSSYFYSIFKKYTGMSPSQYIKSITGDA